MEKDRRRDHRRRKRTGPGGPPGLQNRLLPALSGRAGFDSQAFRQQLEYLHPHFSSFPRLCSVRLRPFAVQVGGHTVCAVMA